jgi:hypothetical protein
VGHLYLVTPVLIDLRLNHGFHLGDREIYSMPGAQKYSFTRATNAINLFLIERMKSCLDASLLTIPVDKLMRGSNIEPRNGSGTRSEYGDVIEPGLQARVKRSRLNCAP